MRIRLHVNAGYIFFETVVAMALLSISMVAIHAAMRQGILARGQAQDYTVARFLLEKIMAEKELQPEMVEDSGRGSFSGEYSRFSYEWKITKIEIPHPEIPPRFPPDQLKAIEDLFRGYMGKITVKISWSRAGHDFEAVGETLIPPGQFWQPPKLIP